MQRLAVPLRLRGHGERSRLQLLFKLGGTENMLILAVNVLAVNPWLFTVYLRMILTLLNGFGHFKL